MVYPRIAVVIIGEPRGFAHPWVWGSIQRNVISALGSRSDAVLCLKMDVAGGQNLEHSITPVARRLNATLSLTWRNGTDSETAGVGRAAQNCPLSQPGKGLWRFATRGTQLRDCWAAVLARSSDGAVSRTRTS